MHPDLNLPTPNGGRPHPFAAEAGQADTQIIDVKITVDPATNRWTFNGKPDMTIEVLPGNALIQLLLESDAAYVTNPVNWFSETGEPAATPTGMSVARDSDTQASILDFNPGTAAASFEFRLTVEAGGQILTSPDPTIINRKTD